MHICIPVISKDGRSSKLDHRFANAHYFAIFDTELKYLQMIRNPKYHHQQKEPYLQKMIQEHGINAVICADIDEKVLRKLNHLGVKVYKTEEKDVAGILEHLNRNLAGEIIPED